MSYIRQVVDYVNIRRIIPFAKLWKKYSYIYTTLHDMDGHIKSIFFQFQQSEVKFRIFKRFQSHKKR